MGNPIAPLAPQLKIGSVLRENKTGRQGVVVGFDPNNPQAPVVKFSASSATGTTVSARFNPLIRPNGAPLYDPSGHNGTDDSSWTNYGAYYNHNLPYSKPGPYLTTLSPDQEVKFAEWMKSQGLSDTPDYDMRGYWLAMIKGDPNAKRAANRHFPDTWKTPYSSTFSRESKYAKPNAPYWEGNNLIEQATAPRPPAMHQTPMEQWSEMLLHEVQSPGPKFEAPAPNLSPYARAIEESAELTGASQAAATRQKQIEDAMKSLGGISRAELEESQGESASAKAKRENLVNTILGRLMEGNLSGEQQDAMLKLLSYAEGKFPTGTDWQVVAHPGMGVYRVNRITGKSVPVLGPNGKQITVPRRESSMNSPAHNTIQANMAGRQTLSQLGAAINGILPDYAQALQDKGIQVPNFYPANVNYIMEHPQYWNLLPNIKDMIGQAYNDLAVDVEEFGVNLPKTDNTAQQLHFIRALARRGGASELNRPMPTVSAPKAPKTKQGSPTVQQWLKSVTGGQ